ncbi:hypothetical protein MHL31_08580 [Lutibacter sp. A80]|uniref:hypothetical protein n=1 Tax=Lutibacter sp. A80 TaxID=2918453 RepID=UPI001F05BD38|nr:hypothetical protein [Lutibacter sp. A80]UMB59137.1 hypothetical protein MHL31_08580 [Lutibacter sp. A80]
MKAHKNIKENSHSCIKEFALKNYKTYVTHFKSRNLQPPMPFQDFLKNYTSQEN